MKVWAFHIMMKKRKRKTHLFAVAKLVVKTLLLEWDDWITCAGK
jgi:hypothetical protein